MKRIAFFVLFVLMSVMVMGQSADEMTVKFIGKLNGNHYQRLDSVRITDVTRNWTETLVYPDTVIVVNSPVNVSDKEMQAAGFEQNVPNPFDCHTSVELAIPQDENVKLQLFDAAGKLCAELNVSLNAGSHRFEITASKPQTYILKAVAGAEIYSVRMINVGSCGADGIKYGGYAGLCTKLTIENEFQIGDDMEYVGYATIAGNVVESEIVSRPLMENQDVVLEFSVETTGTLNGYEWVDLGLPSGLLWATCNVGADSLTGLGNYYAWGETIPKTYYDWLTYVFCYGYENGYGSIYELTKYCYCWTWAYHSITDTLTILEACDDAATANWGAGWRMPGYEEFVELLEYCNVFDTAINGVNGRLYIGPNENSIFFPKAGYWSHTGVSGMSSGSYWSRSLYYYDDGIECEPDFAWGLEISQNDIYDGVSWSEQRCYGRSVRPVCSRDNINDSIVISLPTVTTDTASEITTSGAIVSGNVTSDGGATVTDRGFIYGTSANNLTQVAQSGTGTGNFAANLSGLTSGTTYYYKAYATNAAGTAYGEVMSFTTETEIDEPTGYIDGYAYVDLGLPSGTLWATCNVGANVPEEYGDYYAWGETSTKETFDWSNYSWCNGSRTTLTKYCSDSNCGDNGYTDTLTTLEPSDDVATVIWGNNWRMPTDDELAELVNGCQYTFMTLNGVKGYLAIGPNGNSIFIPAAGHISENGVINATYNCNLWSSTLYAEYPHAARTAFFTSYGSSSSSIYRNCGAPVRPVCSNSGGQISMPDTVVVSFNANGGNGTMDSQIFSVGTLQALHVNGFIREGYVFSGWSTFANGYGTFYSDQQEISIRSNITLYAQWITLPTGDLNGHDYVDLGLPSGTKWATCNVGADSPTDYGDYYAWGELTTKETYSWSNYIYCNGSQNRLTKYCNNSNYGDNGFVDTLITLQVFDDVAADNWGSGWRMPTNDDFNELLSNCTYMVSIQNGVKGMLFIGPNGKSIFLPPGGYRDNNLLFNLKRNALYWSSSLCENVTYCAFYLRFCTDLTSSNIPEISAFSRESGFSVRPVCNPSR